MSLWSVLKKLGRRAAGTYGRVNHKRDKRAASKAVRKFKQEVQWNQIDDLEHLGDDPDQYH